MGFDSRMKKSRLILFLLLCCKYVCYSVSMPTDSKRPERMEKGKKRTDWTRETVREVSKTYRILGSASALPARGSNSNKIKQ